MMFCRTRRGEKFSDRAVTRGSARNLVENGEEKVRERARVLGGGSEHFTVDLVGLSGESLRRVG